MSQRWELRAAAYAQDDELRHAARGCGHPLRVEPARPLDQPVDAVLGPQPVRRSQRREHPHAGLARKVLCQRVSGRTNVLAPMRGDDERASHARMAAAHCAVGKAACGAGRRCCRSSRQAAAVQLAAPMSKLVSSGPSGHWNSWQQAAARMAARRLAVTANITRASP